MALYLREHLVYLSCVLYTTIGLEWLLSHKKQYILIRIVSQFLSRFVRLRSVNGMNCILKLHSRRINAAKCPTARHANAATCDFTSCSLPTCWLCLPLFEPSWIGKVPIQNASWTKDKNQDSINKTVQWAANKRKFCDAEHAVCSAKLYAVCFKAVDWTVRLNCENYCNCEISSVHTI